MGNNRKKLHFFVSIKRKLNTYMFGI